MSLMMRATALGISYRLAPDVTGSFSFATAAMTHRSETRRNRFTLGLRTERSVCRMLWGEATQVLLVGESL